MKHGVLTVKVARILSQTLAPRGFRVLFDHGDKQIDPKNQVGKIVSWFGEYEPQYHMAYLDIAVVCQKSSEVVALVEIEESIATPKVLLGDVYAILLGDGIRFQGKQDLEVDARSVLMVFARAHGYGSKVSQIRHIESRIETERKHLATPNNTIGRVALHTFVGPHELETKLIDEIEAALTKWDTGVGRITP